MSKSGKPRRDATFPFLTVDQARRFRALVVQTFTDAGVEIVAAGADYLDDALGRRLGLSNLAAQCYRNGFGEGVWPSVVAAHVQGLLAAGGDPFLLDKLEPQEILNSVFLRLNNVHVMGEALAGLAHARPVCGALIELLGYRSQGTTRYLRTCDVDRLGLDNLLAAGLENLLREPLPDPQFLVGHDTTVLLLDGESPQTASKVLVLRDVLRRTYGEREFPDGVLVAVPNRNELLVWPIEGDPLRVTPLLGRLAELDFTDAPGPLSPSVFWWRDGELTEVAALGSDGRVAIERGSEFEALARRLSA